LLAGTVGVRRNAAIHEIQVLELDSSRRVRRQPGTLLRRQAAPVVRVLPGPDDVERGHLSLLSAYRSDTSPPWRGCLASSCTAKMVRICLSAYPHLSLNFKHD